MDYLGKKVNNMQDKHKPQSFIRSRALQLLIVCFVILALIPLLIKGNFFMFVFTLIFIFAIYAASWNFLANSGQGSLGHAAFLGIGGFAAAIIGRDISLALISSLGWSQIPVGVLSVFIQVSVVLVGGLFSAGVGLLIGLACVRLKAWYLAMVTFGFTVIIDTLSSQFDSVTNGINGFATSKFVPAGYPFYFLVITFASISIVAMYLIMKSHIGLAFRAIHGNEAEAKMIGINTAKYKLIAFTISTFFAGVAGSLYAYFYQFIDNSVFAPANSFTPLIMSVIGGLGTVSGPIIGSMFLITVQQTLSMPSVSLSLNNALGSYFPKAAGYVGPTLTGLIIGVVLLLIVIFSPKGLSPQLRKFYTWITTDEEKEKKKP